MKKLILTLSGILVFVACQTQESAIRGNNEWSVKMHSMADSVNALLPYVYDRAKFEDNGNRDEIASHIRTFKKNVEDLPKKKGEMSIGPDPLMGFSLNELKNDITAANESFESRQYDYSRSVLKASINHCFKCHTRNDIGIKFSYWQLNASSLDIPLNEKAELYIATRQYKKAAKVLMDGLKNELDSHYKAPYQRERTIKQLLIVLVRAENNPRQALKGLNEIVEKHEVQAYLMQYVQQWRKSLKYWMNTKANVTSYKSMLSHVRKLNKRAVKITKTQPVEAAFVEYLQMSSLLHKALLLAKTNVQKQTVFYYLGRSYQAMKDSGFWDLPEVYFEACVREVPKNKTAKNCFERYKGEVLMGFTGSAGTFLPMQERQKLNSLKKLAGY